MLLDGAPITTLVSHPMQTNYDVIPVEQLERIDIIPGGGSVMYGSGASGGIVNLTSSLNSMNLSSRPLVMSTACSRLEPCAPSAA